MGAYGIDLHYLDPSCRRICNDAMVIDWTPKSNNARQAAKQALTAAYFLHSHFSNEVWLWRGQAVAEHGLNPGMHTRLLNSKVEHSSDNLEKGTNQLISIAREAKLDRQGDLRLPDLALLASLQHHGAATPLLDVTTDPLVALWMVAFASPDKPGGLDDINGSLYGILKPPESRWLDPLDARPFSNRPFRSISQVLDDKKYYWYQAPDVSERLRVQRGSFIIGKFVDNESLSLPIELGRGEGDNWLNKRIAKMGGSSNTASRQGCEVFRIHIRGSLKFYLRELLVERSGLSVRTVFPTPWNKPFIEQFSQGYGRRRPLEHDLQESVLDDKSIPVSPTFTPQ
jgi:hypothetical protein